jgi:nicotinamide riboside transporter PnuC
LLILEWILTVLSIVGVILNIKRKVLCFYIWAISNIGWIFLDYKAELYGQAVVGNVSAETIKKYIADQKGK